eukprot:6078417-Pyramimonas_sp.AAC.1
MIHIQLKKCQVFNSEAAKQRRSKHLEDVAKIMSKLVEDDIVSDHDLQTADQHLKDVENQECGADGKKNLHGALVAFALKAIDELPEKSPNAVAVLGICDKARDVFKASGAEFKVQSIDVSLLASFLKDAFKL